MGENVLIEELTKALTDIYPMPVDLCTVGAIITANKEVGCITCAYKCRKDYLFALGIEVFCRFQLPKCLYTHGYLAKTID